jgi:type VI secretion system protein ImpH
LIEQLAREPYAFDFFRAVRLLENFRRDLPRVGCSDSLAEDPVRFWQNPSLAFAPSTIESFRPATEAEPGRLALRFSGLFGPNSPLPPHITDYARERQSLTPPDRTIAAFINVFHQRLYSLFYRAWAVNQKAVDLDRPADQHYASFVGSFEGIGMSSLQQRDDLPDLAKLFFCGRLSCQTRNAEGLEAILQSYFEVKAEVHTFVGRWMDLPPSSVCRLGESPETGSLGMTTLVGSRFWDCQLSFRIRLGPMGLSDYQRLLPGGPAFQRLKCWVRNYCGEHFIWDLQLVLKADEVPNAQLGQAGRLGWTTWTKTQPFRRDAEDLIVQPPPESPPAVTPTTANSQTAR